LQEHAIQRIGADMTRKVDVRIIAATHRDLEEMVRRNQFREDLYHRLAVMEIRMPPLRERREDIPELAEYFIRRFCEEYGCAPSGISQDALNVLRSADWPGNIRQLQNAIRKALLCANNLRIEAGDITEALRQPSPAGADGAAAFSLEVWVRTHVREAADKGVENLREQLVELLDSTLASEALEHFKGNRSKAARLLGVTRRTVRQRAGAGDA
jgi:DNA-binding NtrC family response regulator